MVADNNIFEQVRNQANIVDVIGKRVELKKKGGEWVGLCPFHDDHNPSMFVSAQKQIYKCFSCGAGGDIFKFIMEYDKVSIKDALKAVASLYQIALPETFSLHQAERIDRFLDMKSINAWTADLYHQYLFQAQGGRAGREYLKTRSIGQEAMKTFKIGYAPPGESGILIQQMQTLSRFKNVSWKKSSLFVSGYRGARDFFRNRIIFPILDEKGEVLGFGGRTIGDEEPKYLNVRESSWFQKRKILYGLKESYPRIIQGKQVYVVEGYLDVVAAYEAGIPAVAPLGTALTREQLLKLKRYVEKVNLLFDGDESGRKAAWRSAQDLVALAMDGDVLLLPPGVDPFDLVKSSSADEVKAFLDTQGVNVYRYLVDEVSRNKQNWSPVEKKQALDRLLPIYASVPDAMVKKNFSEMIGETFSMNWEKYWEERPRPVSSAERNRKPMKPVSGHLVKKERSFVLFLCSYPSYISSAQSVIMVENLEDPLSRYIYGKLLSLKGGIGFQDILEKFREEGQDKVVDFISSHCLKKDFLLNNSDASTGRLGKDESPEEIRKKIQDEFDNRILILRGEYLKKKKEELQKKLKSSQETSDEGGVDKSWYEEYTALKLEENNLKEFLENN